MKHIIFDFDGTLVDSLPVIIEIASEMVPALAISKQDIAMLREMSAREVIKYSGVPYWRLLRLMVRGKKILAGRLDELKVFPGMPEVLKALHEQGYPMSVVSSNSEQNIRKVLKRESIEDYMTAVYGNVGLFNKSRVFRMVLRDQKVAKHNAIYVGDEVRDIEAAKKAKLPIVSVTWGYNGEKILKKYQPTYMAQTPRQLLKVITGHYAP